MATTRRKTAGSLNGRAATTEPSPWTGALRFEVYEENSGRHRWRLSSDDGRSLATSCESFSTRNDAERDAGEHRH
jgi:uncharacterized protein YegP (UPF0339 family)